MRTAQQQAWWQRAGDRLTDWFPFGKAPLILVLLVAGAGAWLALHPASSRRADLTLWTFADIHYYAYLQSVPSFEAAHPGLTVDLQFVHMQAVTSRLRAAFWADLDVPDLVEIEITRAGTFFTGPPEDVGLADLTPRLEAEGYLDRIVRARFSPYSYRDRRTGREHIMGMPIGVNPVCLAYRRDLFEEQGIDPESLATWDDLVRVGQRLTIPGKRYMLDFGRAGGGTFEMALYQRDGGFFDAQGRCIMDDDRALETVLWYVPLVAGPELIARNPGWGQAWAKAIEDGYILMWTCPDWRSKTAETQIPRMAGKMTLMPLPAVRPGGRRTSSWGGTMIGITQKCPRQDDAWALAKHLYLNPEELALRFRELNMLPALKDAWTHPAVTEPRPYWGGQRIGTLFAQLAEDMPLQYTGPYIDVAKNKMAEVVSACATWHEENGPQPGDDPAAAQARRAAFEAFTRARLRDAADEVRRLMTRNPF
jgi:ABC-type glycerol-3-phosphate transport system substrate-binding protein